MNKFFQIPALIIILTSCAYEPILLNKKYDFYFSNIITSGNNEVNKIIKNSLLNRGNATSNQKYDLYIEAEKEKEIISSNSKGDPTVYKVNVYVKYKLEKNGKNIYGDTITRQATYNNINDKFELLQYEENIIKNLSQNISSDILVSITALQDDN